MVNHGNCANYSYSYHRWMHHSDSDVTNEKTIQPFRKRLYKMTFNMTFTSHFCQFQTANHCKTHCWLINIPLYQLLITVYPCYLLLLIVTVFVFFFVFNLQRAHKKNIANNNWQHIHNVNRANIFTNQTIRKTLQICWKVLFLFLFCMLRNAINISYIWYLILTI